jgi:hypothetical protein
MNIFSDPIGQSLAVSQNRVNNCREQSPAAAAEIILYEIDIFLRCGDPVAQAIAAALTQSVRAGCSSGDEIIAVALNAYSIITDPDKITEGVVAF